MLSLNVVSRPHTKRFETHFSLDRPADDDHPLRPPSVHMLEETGTDGPCRQLGEAAMEQMTMTHFV